jgi:hypothetical protein
MEPGIEARDLRNLGHALAQRPDRPQVVRLVQRRERHQSLQSSHDLGGNAYWAGIIDTAMNDAMAHRSQSSDAGARLQPIEQECEGAIVTGWLAFGPRMLVDARARRIDATKTSPTQELFEIARDDRCEPGAVDVEDRELEARRAGVDHQDGVGHRANAAPVARAANAQATP